MSEAKIIPVILSGGSGARLWPISQGDTPKQFLPLMSPDETLFQSTVKRALNIAGAQSDHIVTVTLERLKGRTLYQLRAIDPALTQHVIFEPEARNTAAAILFAARYVRETFGEDALMWVLPSDHHIKDEYALKQALMQGVEHAQSGKLVTFGITPTRAETGFGYIRAAKESQNVTALPVDAFVEKPDADTAQAFLESGDYLWNAGIHLFSAQSVISQFDIYAPEIVTQFGNYSKIPKMAFEHAVLEKTDSCVVVPCSIGWSDMGSWESLWEAGDKDKDGNVKDGRVICKDASDMYIKAFDDRLITCVGVKDLIVVDTRIVD